MANLTRFENDGLELVIDIETGEAFATQSAYSRMSNVAKNTISMRVKGVQSDLIKSAEILTPGGLQGVQLIPAKLVFQWLIKDNPELALAMGEVGATVYLHKLAGYTVTSSAIETPITKPEYIYLPPIEQADKALNVAERFVSMFGKMNPSLEQAFKDTIGNAMLTTTTKSSELWMGVSNFASVELGYTIPKKGEFRDSALGTWIRFYYPELSDKQEKRLCNETQQDIWVYPIHECREQLKNAVDEFFNDPSPGTNLRLAGAFKRNK